MPAIEKEVAPSSSNKVKSVYRQQRLHGRVRPQAGAVEWVDLWEDLDRR